MPVDWAKWLGLGAGAGISGVATGVVRSFGFAQAPEMMGVTFDVPTALVGIGAAWGYGRPEVPAGWAKNILAGVAIGSVGTLVEDLARDMLSGLKPPEQHVWEWYKYILWRAPDPEGFAYWVDRLKTEKDVRAVFIAFCVEAVKELTGGGGSSKGSSSPGRGESPAQNIGDLARQEAQRMVVTA